MDETTAKKDVRWKDEVKLKLNATVVLLLAITFETLIILILLSAILGELKRR